MACAAEKEENSEITLVSEYSGLRHYYMVIGAAALNFEDRFANLRCLIGSSSLDNIKEGSALGRAVEDFKSDVATLSTEVLESYLEDLLDPDVLDDKLCIQRSSSISTKALISVAGVLSSVVAGLVLVDHGLALLPALLITVISMAPFAVLWSGTSPLPLIRRLRLAKLLKIIVTDRRGGDMQDSQGRTLTLRGLLSNRTRTVPRAVPNH